MTDKPRDRIGRWTETHRPATDKPLEPAAPTVQKRGPLGGTYTLTPGVLDDEAIDWYDSHDRLALAAAVAREHGTKVVVQTVDRGSGDGAEVVTGVWAMRRDGLLFDTEHAPVDRRPVGLGVHRHVLDPDDAIATFDPTGSQDYALAETFAKPLIEASYARDPEGYDRFDYTPGP
ncbi:hypothetical protein [Aeromicrobium sp. 179-A 4D2 NHS]|uniref:hypothetical protein n=1 Tax=Aeromicrobium sp. 179-A 4D2 NHS TaxID=3142375 RepID=UPI0039A0FFCB